MLDHDGHLKLADFGLSKEGMHFSEDKTNTFCGTPEYLAPEMLEGKPYGLTVDWWALGIAIYEMLIGLSPFKKADPEQTLLSIAQDEPRFPDRERFNIDYSDELRDLI